MGTLRYPKTVWGLKVLGYAQRHGMTLKELAKRSGVSYNTFLNVRIGKTPGEKAAVVEKVEKYMAENPIPPESPMTRTF